MRSYLVTGGAGFIGSNLAQALLREGSSVTVIDDFSTGLRENLANLDIRVISHDIGDELSSDLDLKKFDAIFHLAARGSVPRSIKEPLLTQKVNFFGTLNLLEASRLSRTPVIFSSSSSVYGENASLPKDEFMWTSPYTPYGASKLGAESLVRAYGMTYESNNKVFRLFNVFGPRQRPDHAYAAVIPIWIWKAMHAQPIVINGDGSQTRDFTFVDDVVAILIKSLSVSIDQPRVNLAFGRPISLNEIVEKLATYFPDIQVKYENKRQGDIEKSENNPSLLKEYFGDFRVTGFDDALSSTIEWYRKNAHLIEQYPNITE